MAKVAPEPAPSPSAPKGVGPRSRVGAAAMHTMASGAIVYRQSAPFGVRKPSSTAIAMHFPMYVISVADFLELDQFELTKVLRRGKLLIYEGRARRRGPDLLFQPPVVVWGGGRGVAGGDGVQCEAKARTSLTANPPPPPGRVSAPNPTLEQLKCVQNMLRSMLAGVVHPCPDFCQVLFKHDVSVSSRMEATRVPQHLAIHVGAADQFITTRTPIRRQTT